MGMMMALLSMPICFGLIVTAEHFQIRRSWCVTIGWIGGVFMVALVEAARWH